MYKNGIKSFKKKSFDYLGRKQILAIKMKDESIDVHWNVVSSHTLSCDLSSSIWFWALSPLRPLFLWTSGGGGEDDRFWRVLSSSWMLAITALRSGGGSSGSLITPLQSLLARFLDLIPSADSESSFFSFTTSDSFCWAYRFRFDLKWSHSLHKSHYKHFNATNYSTLLSFLLVL